MNVPTRFVPPATYNAPSFSFMGGADILDILHTIRLGFYRCVNQNKQCRRGAMLADVNCSRVDDGLDASSSLDGCQHQSLNTGVTGGLVVGGFKQTTHGGHELQFMLDDI